MVKCPKCGTELKIDNLKFCYECGCNLQEKANASQKNEDIEAKLSAFQYIKIGEGKYSIFRLKNKFAESAEVPEGVVEIQRFAFSKCTMLRSVKLPNTLVVIRQWAFQGCTALESIVIPDSVTNLEGSTFQECHSLKRATLPRGLKNIEDLTFRGANALSDIEIPDTVERIGCAAFTGTTIKTLRLPISIKYLTTSALHGNFQKIQYAGTREQWNLVEKEDGYANYNVKVICADDKEPAPVPPKPQPAPAYESPKPTATQSSSSSSSSSGGCYVATCVYGSYDCPEVWTLRRYRDNTLGATWYGRVFVRLYYAISPTLVKWFGKTRWFKRLWRGKLDRMVAKLQSHGVESTPYNDKNW